MLLIRIQVGFCFKRRSHIFHFIFKGLLDTYRANHTSNVYLSHVDFWKNRKTNFYSRTNVKKEKYLKQMNVFRRAIIYKRETLNHLLLLFVLNLKNRLKLCQQSIKIYIFKLIHLLFEIKRMRAKVHESVHDQAKAAESLSNANCFQ